MILSKDRRDGMYVIGFRINFRILSPKKFAALKRAKVLAVSEDLIFVISDKFGAGLIINELLEENVTLLFPNVTVFRLLFDPRAIREPGIIYALSKELKEKPILYVLSIGNEIFLVVRRKDAQDVENAIAKTLEKGFLRSYSLAF